MSGLAPAVVWARQNGLEGFTASAPPCLPNARPTAAVPSEGTFKDGAPRRTTLGDAAAASTRLTLTGTVAGVTCGRIAGAIVDFWQTEPNGRYDQAGFNFRGQQLTDAQGGYRLVTVVPPAAGPRAPHIGVRVRVMGKADFWTELFLADDPRNARDSRYRPELALKTRRSADGLSATFDFLLDI